MTSVVKRNSNLPPTLTRPYFTALFIFGLVLFTALLSACSKNARDPNVVVSGPTMGTQYHITVVAEDKTSLVRERIQKEVENVLEQANQSMSTYLSDSELSRFNRAEPGAWFGISEALLEVLELSLKISEETEGAFDCTVGPLVNLWGFGPTPAQEKAPMPDGIAQALETVGYRYLETRNEEPPAVRKERALYVDLSAIAKGYAVDMIAERFISLGWQRFMIEVGGEVRVAGLSPSKRPWRIGVEKPSLVSQGIMQAISVVDGAIATSGDYRNYRELDGQRYSHTIDPRTGMPIRHTLASVTVIAQTAAHADAYATALSVMGPEPGYEFAQARGLAAYFIIRESAGFGVKYTSSFEQYRVDL